MGRALVLHRCEGKSHPVQKCPYRLNCANPFGLAVRCQCGQSGALESRTVNWLWCAPAVHLLHCRCLNVLGGSLGILVGSSLVLAFSVLDPAAGLRSLSFRSSQLFPSWRPGCDCGTCGLNARGRLGAVSCRPPERSAASLLLFLLFLALGQCPYLPTPRSSSELRQGLIRVKGKC